MKSPLSIIIVTYNTQKATLDCIASIKKYLKKINPQIIVVDNNSVDDTVLNINKKYKSINIIKNKQNLGFSKACNQGAKIADSNNLLFLNSDMLLIDDSFISMLDYLTSHPNIAAIGPQFLNPDHSPQASVFPPQTVGNAIKEFWFKRSAYSKYIPKSKNPISVWSISGGAFLIKKSIFDSLNGWPEKYFFYYEDLDLCRQIRRLNKKIFYYPTCQIIHYHGLSGKKIADPKNQWRRLIKSSIIYHGPFKHYLINLIIKLGQVWQKIK